MSEQEFNHAISYVFTWHSQLDACRKCQALNGRIYRNQDLFANVLVDPVYGPIWDLNVDVSLAHPHCKCTLHVDVEFNPNRAGWFRNLGNIRGRLG